MSQFELEGAACVTPPPVPVAAPLRQPSPQAERAQQRASRKCGYRKRLHNTCPRKNALYTYSTLEAPTCLPFACRPRSNIRLDALARKTGRSKSYHAREAILRQLEDIEDDHLSRRRLRRGGPRVTLESLEKDLKRAEMADGRAGLAGRIRSRRRARPAPARRRCRRRVLRFLRERIAGREDPRRLGHALTGGLEGLWRYRVGDYRIVAIHRGWPLHGAGGDGGPPPRGVSVISLNIPPSSPA